MKATIIDVPANTINPLEYILSRCEIKEDDITYLYRGGDHVCRCGCAGKYHNKGSRGFKMAMTTLKELPGSGILEVDAQMNYINISLDDNGPFGHCICLYIGRRFI